MLEDVEIPRAERQGRAVRRSPDSVGERGAERGATIDLRGSSTQTLPSDYHMAMQSHPKGRGSSRRNRSPPLPERVRLFKSNKLPPKRAFIKPPRFEGKDNCLESHLVQFEIIAKHNQWNDSEKADFLKCSLSGEASHMLRDLDEKATNDDVVSQLRQRYGSLEQLESYRMELKHRKRRTGETLSHLLKDIRRLFLLSYPGPQNYMSLITARDASIDALNDRELMIKVMEREPSNLDQAYKIAERLELYQRLPGGREGETKTKTASKVRGTISESDPLLQSIVETQKAMQKQLTLLSETMKKDRPAETKSNDIIKTPSGKLKGVCHQCLQPEHYRLQCPEWQKRKETEAATGAVSRSVRSRSASRRWNGRKGSQSFFVRPVRNKRGERPVKLKNVDLGSSRGNDSPDEVRPKNDKTLQSSSNGQYPVSPPVDGSAEATVSNDAKLTKEWLEYIRKYPPPPIVPPVQPEQCVPLTQPSVPLTQPSVPLTQPSVPLTQPSVPLTQPSVPLTQPSVPLTQPSVPLTQPSVPLTQPSVPLTQPSVPLTQPKVPLTQPNMETSKQQFVVGSKKNTNHRRKANEEKGEAGTNVCTAGNSFYIEVKLGKERCSGLLNTGSEVTLLLKQLADLSQINRSSRKLNAANGTQIDIVGDWRVTVAVGPLQMSMNFLVSDPVGETLIDTDRLLVHECLRSFSDMTIQVQGYRSPIFLKGDAGNRNRAIVGENLEFSAKTKEVADEAIAIDKPPACQKQIVAWCNIIMLTIIALVIGAYTVYQRTSFWATGMASFGATCLRSTPDSVPSNRGPKCGCHKVEDVGCVRDQLDRSCSADRVARNHLRTKLVIASQRDWDLCNRPARAMTKGQSLMLI